MEYNIKSRLFSLARHAVAAVMVAAVALLQTACHSRDDEPEWPDENLNVSIAIAGQGSSSTRAGDSPDYASGTPEENYIDIADLYVLTFSIPNGKTVLSDDSELLEIMWDPRGAAVHKNSVVSFDGETVWLKGKLDQGIAAYKKDFCVVALANTETFTRNSEASAFEITEKMTFKSLRESGIFDFKGSGSWSWQPSAGTESVNGDEIVKTSGNGIPMFGVKRVNLDGYMPTFHSEKNPYTLVSNGSSTVWMLRALAKVMIELSDNLKDYRPGGVKTDVKIVSASIGKAYNEWFELIPSLGRMQDFTSNGETGQMNLIPGSGFKLTKPDDGNSLDFNIDSSAEFATLYIPEYPFNPTPKFSLTLNIGGENKEYAFDFREYQTNDTGPTDVWWQYVLRNYIYIFTVNLTAENDLSLKVRMAKWDYHKIIFDM